MAKNFNILVMNQISPLGLDCFPKHYEISKNVASPDAIILRSADLHKIEIPASVLAIGRAGAGTNNIPVAAMSARGVPVFNAPGANANAVKELVLSGMLMAARNLPAALSFVAGLDGAAADLDTLVENGKKNFGGFELAGRTLGVIGLGKIGCLIADAAIRLGMNVIGYDPKITVEAAWSLPSQVRKANSLAEVVRNSQFITVHVPLVAETRHMINAELLAQVRPGTVLLNFSRDAVVDEAAAVLALADKRLLYYVCDFPSPALIGHPQAIVLPHLGASTGEAEDNCAIMVANQLRDFLDNGVITNAVNFPDAVAARESDFRVVIANSNVPNMLSQISGVMAGAKLNIRDMLNRSHKELAYTIVDTDSAVPDGVIASLRAIEGVLSVRYLPV
jgi:D-3-phosphoglycerate dehydrogenase